MRKGPKRIITWIIITISATFLAYYIYVESRDYLTGPVIEIVYPINHTEVFGPEVEVRGITKRVSAITLNNSPIYVDQGGAFREKLILPNGYNIMKFDAKDRFGKTTESLLEFVVTSTPKQM